MSTGDINGNIQRLIREAKSIKYPAEPDEVGLRLGDPVALLPILSFALLKFSRHVARFVVRSGFELQGKTDQRFIESSFKLFRDVLNVKTVLTSAQFFEQGFAERKVLLVCDVIGVCKKVHNEEVRQERLSALKATRQQDQAPNARGAVPRRTSPSPVVKVVRNHDDTEVHQVLGAQHLPNATDGAQSVYKTKKLVVGPAARSPSPSPGARTQSSGKGGPRRPACPLNASRGPVADTLELTLGPQGGRAQPAAAGRAGVAGETGRGGGAIAAAGASGSQQQQQPIHAWFLNPAFDEAEGGLGFSFGVSGAPDSSAWWRTAQADGASDGAAGTAWQWAGAPEPGAAVPSSTHPAQPQAHGSGNTGAGGRPGAGYGAHPEELSMRPLPAAPPAASQQPNGGAAPGPKRGTPLPQRRELNEWSFSSFFGPGKLPGQQQQTQQHPPAHGGGEAGLIEGDEEQEDYDRVHRGTADDPRRGAGSSGAGYGGGSAAWPKPPGASDLEALAGDQDRYRGVEWRGPAAYVNVVPQAGAGAVQQLGATMMATGAAGEHAGVPTASGNQGGQQPPRYGSPGRGAAQQGAALRGEASVPDSGAVATLTAQLARMEQETTQQLQQMRDRLAAVDEELAKSRVEAQQSRDVLQARVTVLEGRVRFLECELELCVKRGTGPSGGTALTTDAATGDVGRLGSSPERAGRAQDAGGVAGNGAAGAAAAHTSSSSRPTSAAGEMRASREAAVHPSFSQWGHAAAPGSAAQASMYGAAALPGRSEPNAGQAGPDGRLGYPLYASTQRGGTSVQGQDSVGLGSGLAPRSGVLAASGIAAGSEPPSSSAGSGMRVTAGLSPMPQPAFSFQPSSLMQQVASAQLAPASGGDGTAHGDHGGQGGGVEAQAYPRVSRSLDSSMGQGGLNAASTDGPAWGHTNSAPAALGGSLDASLHGGGPAAAAGAVRQPLGAWRGAAGAGAAPRQGSSILDNLASGLASTTGPATLLPQPQPQQQLGNTGVSRSSLDSHPQPNMAAGASDVGRVGQAALWGVAAGDSAALDAQRPGSVAGRAGAAEGGAGSMVTPATGGGSYRSTDDLINSLYTRYTEAQDFLQTLRRR